MKACFQASFIISIRAVLCWKRPEKHTQAKREIPLSSRLLLTNRHPQLYLPISWMRDLVVYDPIMNLLTDEFSPSPSRLPMQGSFSDVLAKPFLL